MIGNMRVHYEPEDGIYQCIDCGTFVIDNEHHDEDNPASIQHFEGCTPGDADRWEKYYNADLVE